jgi:hypothetical protein
VFLTPRAQFWQSGSALQHAAGRQGDGILAQVQALIDNKAEVNAVNKVQQTLRSYPFTLIIPSTLIPCNLNKVQQALRLLHLRLVQPALRSYPYTQELGAAGPTSLRARPIRCHWRRQQARPSHHLVARCYQCNRSSIRSCQCN